MTASPSPPGGAGGSLLRNAASSYGVRVIVGLSALLLTPYLYRRLGADGFGTWSVMFTIATVFILLETGFGVGVSKLVAELHGQGRRRELEETVAGAVTGMLLLGVVAVLVSVAAGLLGGGLAAEAERGDFRTGMLVLGGAMLLRFPLTAYGATLNGYQRYDLTNLGWVIFTVGFAAGAVAVVESGGGVLGLAIVYAAAVSVDGPLLAVLLARTDPAMPLIPRGVKRATIARIASFSSLTLFIESMVFTGQRMDVPIIAAIRSAGAAAPFAAAVKLQSGVQALVLPFVELLSPMVSDLWARGDTSAVAARLRLSTRVALQLTLPVALGIAIFSHDVVRLWLGGGAPGSTATIVIALMAAQLLLLTSAPAEKTLIGVGSVRVMGWVALADGLLNVAVSVVLIVAYGAVGAAIGTLAVSAVFAPIKLPLACASIGCSVRELVRYSILPAVLLSAPGVAAMVAVRATLDPGAGRLLIGITLGVLLPALLTAHQIGRERLLTAVRGALRRGPAQEDSAAVAVDYSVI